MRGKAGRHGLHEPAASVRAPVTPRRGLLSALASFKALSVVGIVLLAAVIYFSNPSALLASLAKADFFWLLAGTAVFAIILFLNGYRFWLLSRGMGSVSFREAFHVLAFSQVANQGTVAMFGEAAKGALLKKSHGFPASKTLGVILVERGQDVLFSVIFSAMLLYQYTPETLPWVIGLSLAFVGCFSLVLFAPLRLFSFLKRLGKVHDSLLNFREGALKQDKKTLAFSVAVTLVALVLGGFANQFFLQAFGGRVDAFVVLAINSAGLLFGVLSGLPAGLGSREAAFVLLYGLFGVPAAVVVAASIAARIAFTALSYAGFLLSRPAKG